MRAAGGGGRPGPAGGQKERGPRVRASFREQECNNMHVLPRRRISSLPRPAAFVKREAAPHRRLHRAQAGHCAARPPRSRSFRRPRGGGAHRAGSCTTPEGWPGTAAPCAAVPGVPGKALPAPALPEMTPGRPRGAGHPLDALGRPLPGPAARGLFCLPPAAPRAGDYRPAPVRGSPRTTPGHPAQGSRPRPPARGRAGRWRALAQAVPLWLPRSAPPHCPAQRGARRHSASGSSRGPS